MSIDNALILKAQAGNSQAQEEIIKSCTAFIKQWVKRIPSLNQTDYEDLIQEGYLGVIQAINKFNVTKHTKFITYASHWIIKYIYEGLAKVMFHISYPISVRTNYIKISNFVTNYFNTYEMLPSKEEISEGTRIPISQLKDNSIYPQVQLFTSTAVNNNDDNEITILDSLADEDDVQEWALKESLKKEIHNILQKFDERTRNVMILTYGLEGEVSHTYEEVGASLHISRQRIEQILKEAKKTIKNTPEMAEKLRAYCYS